MKFFYDIAVTAMPPILSLLAPASPKLSRLVSGRKGWADKVEIFRQNYAGPLAWFHVASLGEYEQAKPVISALKEKFPLYGIAVSFFSPSGYENVIKKKQPQVDFITYLPFDTSNSANLFVDLLQPDMVFFVKYDLWANYILGVKNRNIPLFLFSASMRSDQIYFKFYGGFFRKLLFAFDHIFTQNADTANLLKQIGLDKISVTGDTRYDRVREVAAYPKPFPQIEKLQKGRKTIVIGSAWELDMDLLRPLINNDMDHFWIIAPHDIHAEQLMSWKKSLNRPTALFSEIDEKETDVLLIDNIGMLSSLYRFAYLAYVGGAAGKGLHNILEPLAYHIPVMFGKVRKAAKFPEAAISSQYGCGFVVSNHQELEETFELLHQPESYFMACAAAKKLLEDNAGSAAKIIAQVAALIDRK
jgi:3-deoxy-D-manno-octulosonic-acid transferase